MGSWLPYALIVYVIGSCAFDYLPRQMDCDQLADNRIMQTDFVETGIDNVVQKFNISNKVDSLRSVKSYIRPNGTVVQTIGLLNRMPQIYEFYFEDTELVFIQVDVSAFIRNKVVYPTIYRAIQCLGAPQFYESYYYFKSSQLNLWYPDQHIIITTSIGNYQNYSLENLPHYENDTRVNIIYYSKTVPEQYVAQAVNHLISSSSNVALGGSVQKRAWTSSINDIKSVDLAQLLKNSD